MPNIGNQDGNVLPGEYQKEYQSLDCVVWRRGSTYFFTLLFLTSFSFPQPCVNRHTSVIPIEKHTLLYTLIVKLYETVSVFVLMILLVREPCLYILHISV